MPEDMGPEPVPNAPEWYTIEQAAEWLQVSTKTIRRYIEAGSLPAVNLGGRAIRIRRQDLEAWLQTRRVEPGLRGRRRLRLGRRPHKATADELANVGVSIAGTSPLQFRCERCGTVWIPEVRASGRLAHRSWRCPRGCNAD